MAAEAALARAAAPARVPSRQFAPSLAWPRLLKTGPLKRVPELPLGARFELSRWLASAPRAASVSQRTVRASRTAVVRTAPAQVTMSIRLRRLRTPSSRGRTESLLDEGCFSRAHYRTRGSAAC